MNDSIYLIILIILTIAGAWISSAEIALFSLSSTKIKSFETAKNTTKRLIASLLAKPRDLLVTVFMINTLVNILFQNVMSSMFRDSGWALKVGLPLAITLVLGEIIPKYLGMQFNLAVALRVAKPIDLFTRWLKPIREWAVAITTPISRILFFFLKKEQSISKDELVHVLETSIESGVLSEDESRLIYGYLDMQDAQIGDLSRPREEVIFYDIKEPLSKLIHLYVDEEVTRIPVCDGDLDHVIGVLHATDFFLYKPMLVEPSDLLPILAKPFFLPENTPARLMMRRLEEKREQMALVVDEHRSVVGLITVEDLVEEVIGEITDRRDITPLFERHSQGTLIASAKMELSEIEELFNIELESEHSMKTIGGWVTEQLGAIPRVGQEVKNSDILVKVLAADEKRVKRVFIQKLEEGKVNV